ncbi:hypothetical protein [Streptomyces sp. IBSBF 3136]|uniref:hypothetical protein n=1 Tax=Streptomyces sp. IBSBF 3136 TaxID=2903524 RepID=UPI002FDBFD90
MGERHSGDGPPRRRHAHPAGLVDGPVPSGGDAAADSEFEARFAAVLRRDAFAAGAEERAVAAFRTARDSGAHRTRTRRRDDWRPRPRFLGRLSPKAALSVFVASLTMGGVAFAAIGSAGSGEHDGDRHPARPSASASRQPGAAPHAPGPGAPSARRDHPATAEDTLAHCRAYEQVEGHGKALASTAWRRLVAAAGGEASVPAYCAERLAHADASAAGRGDASHNGGGSGRAGSGSTGNGGSGSGNGKSPGGDKANSGDNASSGGNGKAGAKK